MAPTPPLPIYAAWGGPSSHIATPAKPWGVSLPYFYAYKSGFLRDFSAALRDFCTAPRTRASDHLRHALEERLLPDRRQNTQVPFADPGGGFKSRHSTPAKPSYALQRGAITLTQLRLQILTTIDLMPLSDPVLPPPLLLRRFPETTKSHTCFRRGGNHPTQLRLQI